MVVAGGFAWANTTVRVIRDKAAMYRAKPGHKRHTLAPLLGRGWPYPYEEFVLPTPVARRSFNLNWLVPNVLVLLVILAATAFACEYLIRRRERKQQEEQG